MNISTDSHTDQKNRIASQKKHMEDISEQIKLGRVDLIDNIYNFFCPHCKAASQVMPQQINCKIFRHAVLKINNIPINPHLPKSQCDELIKRDLVRGCAGPLEFITNPGDISKFTVRICDYK
jgi:hypothetical protein